MTDSMLYFEKGELIAESSSARVYQMDNELFLELGQGHNLWALESELSDYIEQLWDKPRGSCLEIGLGLGVSSRYILSCPAVTDLTTVEINKDVIDVQSEISKVLDSRRREEINFSKNKKHFIIHEDGLSYAYETKNKYDFIFLDFYDKIDEETLSRITDMTIACRRLLKSNGIIVGWFDKSTPNEFRKSFENLFRR